MDQVEKAIKDFVSTETWYRSHSYDDDRFENFVRIAKEHKSDFFSDSQCLDWALEKAIQYSAFDEDMTREYFTKRLKKVI